jgi:hypothetical protein
MVFRVDDPKKIIITITNLRSSEPETSDPGEIVCPTEMGPKMLGALVKSRQVGILVGRASLKVKPRFGERDDAIVRMRDEEGCDWGAIYHRLRRHPEWWKAQGRNPITIRAIREAYRRKKAGTR